MDSKRDLIQLARAILNNEIPKEQVLRAFESFHFSGKSDESHIIHLLYHFLNDQDIYAKDGIYAENQKERILNALKAIE